MTMDYLMAGVLLSIVSIAAITGLIYRWPLLGLGAWFLRRVRNGSEEVQQRHAENYAELMEYVTRMKRKGPMR
jgi:hypothetical protein